MHVIANITLQFHMEHISAVRMYIHDKVLGDRTLALFKLFHYHILPATQLDSYIQYAVSIDIHNSVAYLNCNSLDCILLHLQGLIQRLLCRAEILFHSPLKCMRRRAPTSVMFPVWLNICK